MVKCEVCKREFKNLKSLSVHLLHVKNDNIHPNSSKEYYDLFMKKDGGEFCTNDDCSNAAPFNTLIKGYFPYCSRECSGHDKKRTEKTKATMIKKYGVDNCSKLDWVDEKKKKTCRKNFGVDYPMESKEVQEKFWDTLEEKYGERRPMYVPEIKEKAVRSMTAQRNTEEAKEAHRKRFWKIMYTRITESDRLKEICSPLFSLEEYHGIESNYPWMCNTCHNEFEDNLDDGKIPRCPICHPPLNRHKAEVELFEFCKDSLGEDIEIIRNNRKMLDGLEIDVLIPSLNVGIEHNGLYYHSELCKGFGKDYHIGKTLLAQSKGIRLIHIFEDEWIEKKKIVKSMILNRLGKTENRIYARNCNVSILDNKTASEFYFENHIQGSANGKYAYGLYYKETLVSVISFGKSRYDKKCEYEIYRFCNLINTSVVGGFGKLLKYFIRNMNPKSIMSYSDLRYGSGKVYEKCDFKFIKRSEPGYYYLDESHKQRLSRHLFKKHLLEAELDKFDPNISEWQNMQMNGYDRIWDCGNNVYIWKREGMI